MDINFYAIFYYLQKYYQLLFRDYLLSLQLNQNEKK